MGVFLLGVFLTQGQAHVDSFVIPLRRLSNVNWGVVKDMVMTWILTFPGCGLIGFLMAKLFFILF